MNQLTYAKNKFNRQLHKFGGSSLANAECYKRVIKIIKRYSRLNDLIVVSASGNTTNQLISWIQSNEKKEIFSFNKKKSNLLQYQIKLIEDLILPKRSEKLVSVFIKEIEVMEELIKKEEKNKIFEQVVSHGEIWSARLMEALINQENIQAKLLDSRKFLFAEKAIQPIVDKKISSLFLEKFLKKYLSKILIIPGFIGRNQSGETILLGRNGSDYSATQIGALAKVNKITIWSDVAGIYSADPKRVKEAHLIPSLNIDEANELARLFVPVLHRRTLQPIYENNDIDLFFRCSYDPKIGYTRINKFQSSNYGIKVITDHNNVNLIKLFIPLDIDFFIVSKDINRIINNFYTNPLAYFIDTKKRVIKLVYTDEIIKEILLILKKKKLSSYIILKKNMSLIAVIGNQIEKNLFHSNMFYSQLKKENVDFFWKSKDSTSLIAILKSSNTKNILKKMHSFLKKK